MFGRQHFWNAKHRAAIVSVVGLISFVLCSTAAWALKPDSPEVKKLVEKGLKYLETASDSRLGGQCLLGLAEFKAGADIGHKHIVDGLAKCREGTKIGPAQNSEDIYSIGVAVIFLCEIDPVTYADEIQYYLDLLKTRQKKCGGWGYENSETGDTSMTQYGVLSHWTAKQAGFKVPEEVIENVANWLVRTQDPSGAWGYQGVDPGNYEKVVQSEIRLSLTTAALGSTLIAANLLGIIDMADDGGEELPPALKPVQEDAAGGGRVSKNVDPGRMRGAVGAGTGWFRKNYEISPPGFTNYYLYALERFMSFKELADGKRTDDSTWYNDGVKYLTSSQLETGAWSTQSGDAVDTAFAILFLLRSTKKAIEKTQAYGDGVLTGGRGLPKNTTDVKLSRGRLVNKNQGLAVEEMLKVLGDPDDPELEAMADYPEEIKLSEDEKARTEQLKQLRQVVRGGVPKARLAAVRALGKSREVRHVPLLIYALTDPDPTVAIAADEALRYVSRKLDVATMKAPINKAARDEAEERWRAWFTKFYPDMALED